MAKFRCEVVPANCLRPTNFYDQLVATTLFPIGILLILALIYFIHSRWTVVLFFP